MKGIDNLLECSPFGGIPRNWKLLDRVRNRVEPGRQGSPFGGIPRNWKRETLVLNPGAIKCNVVPPSGGSLEIGNVPDEGTPYIFRQLFPLRGDP